ncbi:DUF4118 domain-containing protein [Xylophilus sp. Kf1]|nr:DUF4118 domain-containing protein [Xylophilus sp. Kf1]
MTIPETRPAQYAFAAIAVGAGLLLRFLLNPVLGQQGPYLILTLPIVAAAVYGGFGPALLATALGTSAGTYLFISRGAGWNDVVQPENVARIVLFLVIGLAIGLMGGQWRRSRAALADTIQQLQASNRAKDKAMAVLGHEIRNPLAAIQSAQTLLQRASDDERRVVKAAEIIGRQVAQMRRMADDLLDLASLGQDSPRAPVAVDLRQVLQQAIEQSEPLNAKKRHCLHVALGDRPVVVPGDAQRLVQVFANLLINAAKYTEPAGEITLTLLTHGLREVEVTVADTGVGLEPDSLPQLFEPFVQAPGATAHAEGGLGLGLAIVQKIVLAHGGRVTAESPGLGQGSRFSVVLPLANGVV